MAIDKVLYRASAKATGGRDGRAVSSDNALDVKLSTPKELGGAGGEGTNPEQLFAAGYSACFLGAMKFVAATGGPGACTVEDFFDCHGDAPFTGCGPRPNHCWLLNSALLINC